MKEKHKLELTEAGKEGIEGGAGAGEGGFKGGTYSETEGVARGH